MKKIYTSIYRKSKYMNALYTQKKAHIAGASCFASFIIGTGKLIMGILSLSFFACANALYTYGIVLSKVCAIRGISLSDDVKRQCKYYKYSGVILMIASFTFLLYSIKLILYPVSMTYSKYEGIFIAFITFVEIGINIKGMIIERSNHNIMYHALKSISFASALISLVLTQTAILSFTSQIDNVPHNDSYNGYLGIFMAVLATLVGVFMIYRGTIIEQGRNYRSLHKKIEKFLRREHIEVTMLPKKLIHRDEKTVLLVDVIQTENFEIIQKMVWDEFHIELHTQVENI